MGKMANRKLADNYYTQYETQLIINILNFIQFQNCRETYMNGEICIYNETKIHSLNIHTMEISLVFDEWGTFFFYDTS